MKKNSFLKNVTVLLFSQIVIKVIGIIYKLYLTNKNGYADTGNAIFSTAFQGYAIVLTLCSIGIPNAISSIISSRFAIGDNNGSYRILKISICTFGTIGFLGSIILYYFSDNIANVYFDMPEASLVLKVLAPSVFVTTISSVFKGYFNGKGKMDITAKALSMEQIVKTILVIAIVELFSYMSKNNTIIMVCAVGITTTLSSIINCAYMYICYLKNRREIWTDLITSKKYKKERKIHIIKEIFKVAMPITICALIASTYKTIDAFTIVRIAKKYLGEAEAIRQYGILSGKVESLIVLPFSFNMALVTTLIPAISGYKAIGATQKIKDTLKFTMLAGIIISIPYFVVVYLFPTQILQILFPNASDGSNILKISSLGIVLSMIMQSISGYLQGMNKMKIQMISVGTSAIIKLALNVILISNKRIGILGAVFSSLISNCVALTILLTYLIRKEKIEFELKKFLIKPLIISIAMYLAIEYSYKVILINSELLKIFLSTAIGIVIYGLAIIGVKLLNKYEIRINYTKEVDINGETL